MEANLPYKRRAQIIVLIHSYGILSSSALQRLLKPKIDKRRLRVALDRMQKRKLIYKRAFGPFGKGMHYYQLHPSERSQPVIAASLKASNAELGRPQARFEDPMQCQVVAIWAERIKHDLPAAHVVPRVHFRNDPIANAILPAEKMRLVHQPEILVSIKDSETARPLNIFISLDPWTGGQSMPLEKIKLLAENAQVDGVLHIASHEDLVPQVANSDRQRWKCARFKHYAGSFLTFSSAETYVESDGIRLITHDRNIMTLSGWVQRIASETAAIREVPNSDRWAPPGPSSFS